MWQSIPARPSASRLHPRKKKTQELQAASVRSATGVEKCPGEKSLRHYLNHKVGLKQLGILDYYKHKEQNYFYHVLYTLQSLPNLMFQIIFTSKCMHTQMYQCFHQYILLLIFAIFQTSSTTG